MKAITLALLILASTLAVHFALGAATADRPAGVDARIWIPVTDKLGFVVTRPAQGFPAGSGDRQALIVSAPTEGYFMVRRGDVWQRIAIKDPLIGPTG